MLSLALCQEQGNEVWRSSRKQSNGTCPFNSRCRKFPWDLNQKLNSHLLSLPELYSIWSGALGDNLQFLVIELSQMRVHLFLRCIVYLCVSFGFSFTQSHLGNDCLGHVHIQWQIMNERERSFKMFSVLVASGSLRPLWNQKAKKGGVGGLKRPCFSPLVSSYKKYVFSFVITASSLHVLLAFFGWVNMESFLLELWFYWISSNLGLHLQVPLCKQVESASL